MPLTYMGGAGSGLKGGGWGDKLENLANRGTEEEAGMRREKTHPLLLPSQSLPVAPYFLSIISDFSDRFPGSPAPCV